MKGRLCNGPSHTGPPTYNIWLNMEPKTTEDRGKEKKIRERKLDIKNKGQSKRAKLKEQMIRKRATEGKNKKL